MLLRARQSLSSHASSRCPTYRRPEEPHVRPRWAAAWRALRLTPDRVWPDTDPARKSLVDVCGTRGSDKGTPAPGRHQRSGGLGAQRRDEIALSPDSGILARRRPLNKEVRQEPPRTSSTPSSPRDRTVRQRCIVTHTVERSGPLARVLRGSLQGLRNCDWTA